MTDPIQEIEERYARGKPSVGLPQIFTDIQDLIKVVRAYENLLMQNSQANMFFIPEIKKRIFGEIK